MAFNPKKKEDLGRLWRAVEWSRGKLEPFRRRRKRLLKEYVGENYSDSGADDPVPVNFIELGVNTYVRFLAANAPRALVSPRRLRKLAREADDVRLALNHLAEEIRLADTLRRAVYDAMFCMGIVKTGMESRARVEVDGYLHDVGQPFADTIDVDDWVHDMSSKRWDQVAYEGNRYWLPMSVIKEQELFDPKFRNKLKASDRSHHNAEGDYGPETLSQTESPVEDEYDDYAALYELWLPRENLILTLSEEVQDIVDVREWSGPESGPFRKLTFNDVPGNLVPLAPAVLWYGLHSLGNKLFNKAAEDAEHEKSIGLFRGGTETTVERINNCQNGEWAKMEGGDWKVERFGGASQTTLFMFLQCRELFNSVAGNLELLGGLSAQSGTLGQDQMLQLNASKRVGDMQERVISFSRDIMKDLAFYLVYDPFIEIPIVKRVGDFEIHTKYSAETREGDYLDYNFDIQPYSMQYRSPGEKLAMLMQIWQGIILPYSSVMQQSGMQPNIQGLLDVIADYADLPELKDIVQTQTGGEEQGPIGERPMKSPVTQRNYTRTSRPGATSSGKSDIMSRLLTGMGAQNSEAASLLRPSG